jgi:hypothetical protein
MKLSSSISPRILCAELAGRAVNCPLFARNSAQARNCLILLLFMGRIRRMKLRMFNNQHGIAIGPIAFMIVALTIPWRAQHAACGVIGG